MNHNRTLFEDAIDIPIWLEADRTTPYADRVARDRRSANDETRTALDAVRIWWTANRPAEPSTGESFERARGWISLVMVCIGGMTGAGLAAAVLRYDGSHPVNAVTVFSGLVGLQWLLIAITLLLLPQSIPGLRTVTTTLGQINPATIVAAIYRRVTRARLPPEVLALLDWHNGRTAAARFSKWQLLTWSQGAAIAFNAGAIATSLLLVTFTDLAFGWSTTLDVSAAQLQQWTAAIAWPWSQLVPAAVPSTELIEGSRFFRLEGSTARIGAPESYIGWWPFLLLSVIVYGLLPRLALLWLSRARLSAATRALLLEDHRVVALLDRMSAPTLTTAATDREQPRRLGHAAQPIHLHAKTGNATAIIWSDALDPAAAKARARERLQIELQHAPVSAGGGASLADDAAAFDRVCALQPRIVVVFVRAYEPPLLELTDTLVALRHRLGSATVVVHPVPEPDAELVQADVDTWRRTIAALRDPHTYVEAGS